MKPEEYSIENQDRIRAWMPDATELAGYRTWQKRGRRIKEGSRGCTIHWAGKRRKLFDVSQTELDQLGENLWKH